LISAREAIFSDDYLHFIDQALGCLETNISLNQHSFQVSPEIVFDLAAAKELGDTSQGSFMRFL
jgi:hypothetical protein